MFVLTYSKPILNYR